MLQFVVGLGDMTASITLPDGTVIGFETVGDGPPMVLVHGIGADHTRWTVAAGGDGYLVRLFAGTESPGHLRPAAQMDFDPEQFTEAVFTFDPG